MKVALATPAKALCVKRVGVPLYNVNDKKTVTHGRLVSPAILVREVSDNNELAERLKDEPKVVVVGHGLFQMECDTFVWTGTPDEFWREWQGD